MVSLRPRRSTAGQFREVLSDGEEERSGESDFVPEGADEKETNVSSDAPEEDDVSEEQIDEEEEDRAPKKKKRKPTSEPKFSLVTTNWVPKKSKKANAPSQAGLASNVQARASGPAGSSSGGHYKRPPPLYLRPAPIRRLIEEPKPLGTPRTVPSNSGHGQPLVQSRIAKSWARCIGLGPIWQLIEDRSWFKERAEFDEELETRPCVYEDLELLREQVLLSEEEACKYIPHDSGGITCAFGPRDKQTKRQLSIYDSLDMKQFFSDQKGHHFYAGAPVWALDWCPLSAEYMKGNNNAQYLAIAPLTSKEHVIQKQRSGPACIQIWRLSKLDSAVTLDCPLVLCIDSGCALQLKWCPLPTHRNSEDSNSTRLGLLAGVFEDGSVSVYACPDPLTGTGGERAYVHLPNPVVKFRLEDAQSTALDWANSELIAIGLSTGSIAVYNISDAFQTNLDPQPLYYLPVHQVAIRDIAWVRVPPVSSAGQFETDADPSVIISVGYDGAVTYTDLMDQSSQLLHRLRDVLNSVAVSYFTPGALVSDSDGSIRSTTLSPAQIPRGQFVMDPSGPAMSIDASDYHPIIAVGSTNGACSVTNGLRYARRGTVPFLVYEIFQLDYSEKEDGYRMLDHIMPRAALDRNLAGRRKDVDGQAMATSVGPWPAEVCVTCIRWNSGSGMHNSPFLASATASGLCRIDWLLGKFHRNRVPFVSVEAIRGEIDQGGGSEDDELLEE